MCILNLYYFPTFFTRSAFHSPRPKNGLSETWRGGRASPAPQGILHLWNLRRCFSHPNAILLPGILHRISTHANLWPTQQPYSISC